MKTKILFLSFFSMFCWNSETTFAQNCFDYEIYSCYYYPSGYYTCECVDTLSAPAQQCSGGQVLACRLDQHCDWECECMDPSDVAAWQSHGHDCTHGSGNNGGHNGWWHHFHGYRSADDHSNLNDETLLETIFPNPVSSSAVISFSLEQSQHVSLEVLDMTGRVIATLTDRTFEKGENEIVWNVAETGSGIYFLIMEAGDIKQTERITIAK